MNLTYFISYIKHKPYRVLLLILFLTVLSILSAVRIQQDQSIEIMFLKSDKELVTYNRFSEIFVADEVIIIGITVPASYAPDIYTPTIWSHIDDLSEAARNLPYIHNVSSATTLINIDTFEEEELTIKQQVSQNSLVKNSFISADESTTAIVLQMARANNSFENKRELVDALKSLLSSNSEWSYFEFSLSGTPVFDERIIQKNEDDMSKISPLMVLMIFIVAWITLKRLSLALLPLTVGLITLIMVFGFMSAVGYKLTLLSSALIPLILAISVADAIHIICHFTKEVEYGTAAEKAIGNALKAVFVPCFFTSITTAGGLLALQVSKLVPMGDFGLVAAVGIMLAFVVSILFIPAILTILVRKTVIGKQARSTQDTSKQKYTGFILRLSPQSPLKRKMLIAGFVALTFIMILQIFRLDVSVNALNYLDPDEPLYKDTLFIDDKLGGSLSVEFLVSTKQSSLGERERLVEIDDFQQWLVENTLITQSTSISSILKQMANNGVNEAKIPSDRTLAIIFENMSDNPEIKQWLSEDLTHARISARVPISQGESAMAQIPLIEREIATRFQQSPLTVELTGFTSLLAAMKDYLIKSQVEGLIIAIVIIASLIGLLLKSSLLFMLALTPNLIPIIIGIGSMTLLGISLNPATAMIGTMMLGIVVDDTVHFLVSLKRNLKNNDSVEQSINRTIDDVGTPILVTSIILVLSFLALTLSSFAPSREIGIIVPIIIVAAFLITMVLLPALIKQLPQSQKIGLVRAARR